MKKNQLFLLCAVLVIIGVSFYLRSVSNEKTFNKKQECSQNYELVKTKLKDNPRIFQGETYAINEVFYSPKMNTCLYAYIIKTNILSLYNIDDVFGGNIFAGSVENDFYKKISELKK